MSEEGTLMSVYYMTLGLFETRQIILCDIRYPINITAKSWQSLSDVEIQIWIDLFDKRRSIKV